MKRAKQMNKNLSNAVIIRQHKVTESEDRAGLKCGKQQSNQSFQIPSVSSNFISGFDISSANMRTKQPCVIQPKNLPL
jgi:hypothetical protein